jgi:hypothetical protein
MLFSWAVANSTIFSQIRVVCLALGLGRCLHFSNSWAGYSCLLVCTALLLCELPVNTNFSCEHYGVFWLMGFSKLPNATTSWDFIYWANFLFSFQIYVATLLGIVAYLLGSALLSCCTTTRLYSTICTAGSERSYMAFLLNLLLFGISSRANILLFGLPVFVHYLFFQAPFSAGGMLSTDSYLTMTLWTSAYLAPGMLHSNPSSLVLWGNLPLQPYYVILHTLFILLLFFFSIFFFLLLRYFYFTRQINAFTSVMLQLSGYFIPALVSSLFFGGLWSMYNDFFFLFWSWDYIELFFVDFILFYIIFGHIYKYKHVSLSQFFIIPVLLIKLFRLSILESTHHLSLFDNSVLLSYCDRFVLFINVENCWTYSVPHILENRVTSTSGFNILLLFFRIFGTLVAYFVTLTLFRNSHIAGYCVIKLGLPLRPMTFGYIFGSSQYYIPLYCYYGGLFFILLFLIFGSGYTLVTFTAVLTPLALHEFHYVLLILWLIFFFFWSRYFTVELLQTVYGVTFALVTFAVCCIACQVFQFSRTADCHLLYVHGHRCATYYILRIYTLIGKLCAIYNGFYPLPCRFLHHSLIHNHVCVALAIAIYLCCVVGFRRLMHFFYLSYACSLIVLTSLTWLRQRATTTSHYQLRGYLWIYRVYVHLQLCACFVFLLFCFSYQTFSLGAVSYTCFTTRVYYNVLGELPELFDSFFCKVEGYYPTTASLANVPCCWHVSGFRNLAIFHGHDFAHLFSLYQHITPPALGSLWPHHTTVYADFYFNQVANTGKLAYRSPGIFTNFSAIVCCWGLLWCYELFFTIPAVIFYPVTRQRRLDTALLFM